MILSINDIDTTTQEGKLLMASLAIITTNYEPGKTPGEVIALINDQAVKMEFLPGL